MGKLYVLLLLLTITLMIPLFSSRLFAAPLNGETIYNVKQPDGTTVPVRYFGDEFFATAESPDGYTLVENREGWYTYAALNDDKSTYIPTETIYKGGAFRGIGEKHLRINQTSMREKIEAGRNVLNLPTLAEERENFLKRKPKVLTRSTVDTIIGLTLLIDFPDQKSSIPKGDIEEYLNKEGYDGYGNAGSVRDYFYDVSNKKWVYLNVVTEFYTAKNNKSYYDNNITWDSDFSFKQSISCLYEALQNLIDKGFDFSQISLGEMRYDGTRSIRALNVLYAGTCESGWSKGLWPHKGGINKLLSDTISATTYQISDIKTNLSLSVFIHENGHSLCGFPDLYSYSGGVNVVQSYCNMASTGYGLGLKRPMTYNPYFRSLMGWLDLIDIDTLTTGNEYSDKANDAEVYFSHFHDTTEWFFIENRRRDSSWNYQLKGDGLLIWHANKRGYNTYPSEKKKVEIVQADGRNSLEKGGLPNAEDLWSSTTNSTFNATSTPNSNWSDSSESGIDIRNISEAGEVMTFTIGEGKVSLNSNKSVVKSGLSIGAISNQIMTLYIPETDLYTITLTDLNGRQLIQFSRNIKAGVNSLNLTRFSLCDRVLIASIEGKGNRVTKKVVVK